MRGTFRVRSSLALLSGLLLLPGTVQGNYREHYANGVRALDQKRWAEVANEMRSAIAEESQAGERVRIYGTRFERYTPYYYLGLALYYQDDCQGAVEQWEIATAQGAVADEPRKNDELARLRQDCRGRLVAPAVLQNAENAISDAQAAQRNLDEARSGEGLQAWGSDPSLAERENQARSDLGSAQRWLRQGRDQNDPAAVSRATDLANKARTELASLRADLDAAKGRALDSAIVEARTAIGQASESAQDLEELRRDPTLAGVWRGDSTLGKRWNEAQGLLTEARTRLATGEREASAVAITDAASLARKANDDLVDLLETLQNQGQANAQATLQRAIRRAQDQIGRAEDARSALDPYRQNPRLVWSESSLLGEGEASADVLLQDARRGLADGRARNDPAAVEAAGDLAAKATSAFDALRGEAARLAAQRTEPSADPEKVLLWQQIGDLVKTAEDVLSRVGAGTASDEVTQQQRRLTDLMDQAGKAAVADPVATLEALRRDLSNSTAILEALLESPRPNGPPAELRAAASVYFQGQYRQALDLLETKSFENQLARAQSCLFRAAARWGLYESGGRTETGLMDEMARDIESCHELDPQLSPDPKYFPPPFVALFDGGS